MKIFIPLISIFLLFVLPNISEASFVDRIPFTIEPGIYWVQGANSQQLQIEWAAAWGVSVYRSTEGWWQGDLYLQGELGRDLFAEWSYGAIVGVTEWFNTAVNPDVIGLQLSGVEIRRSLMHSRKVGLESINPSFYDLGLILNHSQFEGRDIRYGLAVRMGDEVSPGRIGIRGLTMYVTFY